MALPDIVAPTTSMAGAADTFSLLSYNLLLPNSVDGWWVFKYYDPRVPMAQRQWPHRQQLLKAQMMRVEPDVVAFQELSADSFEQDMGFMAALGYDHVLHRKFRMRNATFFKRDRFELVTERHKDRTLLTTLRDLRGRHVHVLNCHLAGGPYPERRFRQAFEGLDQIRKEAKKLGHRPEEAAVLVCGDFNSFPGVTALERLLGETFVEPDHRDPGFPERAITSKRRGHPFGPLKDVYLETWEGRGPRPATLIVSALTEHFLDRINRVPSEPAVALLRTMFDAFAVEGELDMAAIERWLNTINGQSHRGSERRKAFAILEAQGRTSLRFEDFQEVYVSELSEGKVWSFLHDVRVCTGQAPALPERPHGVCIDRIYYSGALIPKTVRDPLTQAQRRLIYEDWDLPPNAWHPSDHLPVAASFAWSEAGG